MVEVLSSLDSGDSETPSFLLFLLSAATSARLVSRAACSSSPAMLYRLRRAAGEFILLDDDEVAEKP